MSRGEPQNQNNLATFDKRRIRRSSNQTDQTLVLRYCKHKKKNTIFFSQNIKIFNLTQATITQLLHLLRIYIFFR